MTELKKMEAIVLIAIPRFSGFHKEQLARLSQILFKALPSVYAIEASDENLRLLRELGIIPKVNPEHLACLGEFERFSTAFHEETKKVTDIYSLMDEGGRYILIWTKNGQISHKVPVDKEYVAVMKEVIYSFPIGEWIEYNTLISALTEAWKKRNIDLSGPEDSWAGGKRRSQIYFPYHYRPLKVLEYQQFIEYSPTGKVRRLK